MGKSKHSIHDDWRQTARWVCDTTDTPVAEAIYTTRQCHDKVLETVTVIFNSSGMKQNVFPPEPAIIQPVLDSYSPNILLDKEYLDIQEVVVKHRSAVFVTGSRSRGEGRNIATDLPVGKGPRTRSDIDIRVDGDTAIHTNGHLEDDLLNIGDGKTVECRTLPSVHVLPYIFIGVSERLFEHLQRNRLGLSVAEHTPTRASKEELSPSLTPYHKMLDF